MSIRIGRTYEPNDEWTVVEVATEDVPEFKRLLAASERNVKDPCTGVTATWCCVHGDCVCPRTRPDGDFDDGRMDDPSCPLHAPSSLHGDLRPQICDR